MMQKDPLKPGYNFNAHLVAGLTPINKEGELDFTIDRPQGMKGYIINYTCQGEGTLFSGDDSFDVEKGDLLLFPPNAQHFYHRKTNSNQWNHRWIYFRSRASWQHFLDWHYKKKGVYITRGSGLTNETKSTIEQLFVDIETYTKSKELYRYDLAINLLEQLLIRCKLTQPNIIKKPLDARVVEAMNFIAQNLSKDYSLENIATHVCLSSSRIGHLFRNEVGITTTQWRDDQRITKAKQLLVTSQNSINHIGRLIGYSDPLYFSRVFKRKVGLSPKQYRDQVT